MRANLPAASFLTVLFAFASAATTSAQTYSTRHYDKLVPLALDATRIAVLSRDAGAPLAAALAAHGIASDALRAIPLGGGALVTVPAGRSPTEVVAAIASDASQLFAAPVFLDSLGGPIIPTAGILLRFKADVGVVAQLAVLDALSAATGARVAIGPGWAGLEHAYKLSLPTRDGFEVLDIANALAGRPEVRFATPNWIITGSSDLQPTDPLFADSWALDNSGQTGGTPDEDMDAAEAWDITTGDADVIVAVLDVGVQQDHPDIAQMPGEDFVLEASGGGPFNACDNHGTVVAGCISAIISNGLGSVGVAPGCRVVSARTFSSDTFYCDGSWYTYISSTAEALAWAESIGARVSNNSNFYGFTDASIEDAYADTRAAGMVHFASAGNFAVSFVEYPASLPDVLAVSATDQDGSLAWFSSWGTSLDLSAPGLDVISTDRTGGDGYYPGDHGLVSGTSFSAPFCAAVAALVISRNPWLSSEQVENILLESAIDHGVIGYDDVFGWGVVNAQAALLDTPADPWNNLGSGLAGIAGAPSLSGTGGLFVGTQGALLLSNAAPSALSLLFVALSGTPSPFKCGTLVPVPFVTSFTLATSPSGAIPLGWASWPAGLSGLSLYFQYAIQDAGAICGAALSNALRADVP